MSIRLLHTSDIHLGATFKVLGERGREQHRQVRETFARVVGLAIEERVDAVLIAGDLFDSVAAARVQAPFAAEQLAGERVRVGRSHGPVPAPQRARSRAGDPYVPGAGPHGGWPLDRRAAFDGESHCGAARAPPDAFSRRAGPRERSAPRPPGPVWAHHAGGDRRERGGLPRARRLALCPGRLERRGEGVVQRGPGDDRPG
ncbi:MAG: hypothetical protein E6H03_07620 [Bacillati bacterium ANGP1]|uniref:Calcineurin-like phosphoesterase domain-containing protein n=1 Tax=Candidatus Segetimicrobium genomatis TaxID=2569760 RepID=A0A537JC16_9BACT|nr:MAG: hypothetical protein E6H03_07620 [Terrabacteria group bacterium ANGP1]